MRDLKSILKTVDVIFLDMNDLLYQRGFFDAQKLALGKRYLHRAFANFFGMDGFAAQAYTDILCRLHKYPMMAIDALVKQFPAHKGLQRFHEAHYAPYWKAIEKVDYTVLKKDPELKSKLLMLDKLGIRISISTNSYKDEAKAILQAIGLRGLFQHVIFGEKLAPHGKYTVDGFHIIRNIVNADSKRHVMLFIDDDPEKLHLAKLAFGQDIYTVLLRNDLYPKHVAERAAQYGHRLPTKRSELPADKPEGVDAYARSLELVLDYVIQHKGGGNMKV